MADAQKIFPIEGTTSGGTGLTGYAAGDILYASATNTLARRAKGTNGQYLTLSGGFPAWASVSAGFTPNKAFIISSTGSWTTHATVAAAITAASSGQIVVANMPSTPEKLTLKDGVDLLFLGDVTGQSGSSTLPIFNDSNGAVTCSITVLGDINYTSYSVPTGVAGIVQCHNPSVIDLSVLGSIKNIREGVGFFGGTADAGATLTVRCRSIIDEGVGGLGIDMGAFTGLSIFTEGDIVFGDTGITDTGTVGGSLTVSCGGSLTAVGAALEPTETSLSTFSFFVKGDIIGATEGITWNGGVTLFATARSIIGMTGAGITTSAGVLELDVHGIYGGTYGMDAQAASTVVFMRDARLVASAAGGVALKLATNGVTARGNLALVSEGTATDSVTAGAAQTMKCYGTVVGNKAKNANVTIQVAPAANQIFSDANVT